MKTTKKLPITRIIKKLPITICVDMSDCTVEVHIEHDKVGYNDSKQEVFFSTIEKVFPLTKLWESVFIKPGCEEQFYGFRTIVMLTEKEIDSLRVLPRVDTEQSALNKFINFHNK